MKDKDKLSKDDKQGESAPASGRYTIFHALYEAMKDKDKKRRRK